MNGAQAEVFLAQVFRRRDNVEDLPPSCGTPNSWHKVVIKVQLLKPDKKPTLLSVSPGLRGLTKRSSRFRSPPLRSQTCTEYTV